MNCGDASFHFIIKLYIFLISTPETVQRIFSMPPRRNEDTRLWTVLPYVVIPLVLLNLYRNYRANILANPIYRGGNPFGIPTYYPDVDTYYEYESIDGDTEEPLSELTAVQSRLKERVPWMVLNESPESWQASEERFLERRSQFDDESVFLPSSKLSEVVESASDEGIFSQNGITGEEMNIKEDVKLLGLDVYRDFAIDRFSRNPSIRVDKFSYNRNHAVFSGRQVGNNDMRKHVAVEFVDGYLSYDRSLEFTSTSDMIFQQVESSTFAHMPATGSLYYLDVSGKQLVLLFSLNRAENPHTSEIEVKEILQDGLLLIKMNNSLVRLFVDFQLIQKCQTEDLELFGASVMCLNAGVAPYLGGS